MLCLALWMMKVLSTFLNWNLSGWVVELMVMISNSSMNRLAKLELMGYPMATSYTCS